MHLQTLYLLKRYGVELIEGTISDKELIELMQAFRPSAG